MVENMNHWLARQMERLNESETAVASGKRVNKPSDDPSATARILEDRTTISKYARYQSNIDQASTWIKIGNNILETVYDLLDQAQDIATNQSTGDLSTRKEMAASVRTLFAQIIDLANTRDTDGYFYSGHQTDTKPFANQTTVASGAAQDLVFELDSATAGVDIEILDQSGNLVRTLTLSGGAEGTNTVAWDGLDDGGLAVADGIYTYTVTAAAADGSPVASWPTYRGDDGSKKTIINETTTLTVNTDGGAVFDNALAALSRIITVLEDDDFEVSDLSSPIADLEQALTDCRVEMIALASANSLLEMADAGIEQRLLIYQNRIEQEESCDLTAATLELKIRQTNYDVIIEAAAKILNMSTLIGRI
jgi:flagellar hook-associated protein 3 FlgL